MVAFSSLSCAFHNLKSTTMVAFPSSFCLFHNLHEFSATPSWYSMILAPVERPLQAAEHCGCINNWQAHLNLTTTHLWQRPHLLEYPLEKNASDPHKSTCLTQQCLTSLLTCFVSCHSQTTMCHVIVVGTRHVTPWYQGECRSAKSERPGTWNC